MVNRSSRKQPKKPRARNPVAPKARNPVAKALRLSKPKVEPGATTYSRKRLKKPTAQGNGD